MYLREQEEAETVIKLGPSYGDGGFLVTTGAGAGPLALQFAQMGGGWTTLSQWRIKSGGSHSSGSLSQWSALE